MMYVHGMGTIVSAGKESSSDETYPTAAVAQQAKLRQAALSLHPHLVWSLAHSEAFGEGEGNEGDPDWYPAGVSPWYRDHRGLVVDREPPSSTQNNQDWIDQIHLNKCDLHRSAILIQKFVRGHQVRKELFTRQQSAAKIQRVFRYWRNGPSLNGVCSLPSLGEGGVSNSEVTPTGRALSAHTGKGSQHARSTVAVPNTILEGEQQKEPNTWNQQLSLKREPVHEKKEMRKSKEQCSETDTMVSEYDMIGPTNAMVISDQQLPVPVDHSEPTNGSHTASDGIAKQPMFCPASLPTNVLHNSHSDAKQHINSGDAKQQVNSHSNARQHVNSDGGAKQHVIFPSSLVAPLVRTGYSRSNAWGRSSRSHGTSKKRRATRAEKVGAHLPEFSHKQNVTGQRTIEGREDASYPDMAPQKTLKQQCGVVKGGANGEMTANSGIRSMTLQNFDQRWIKPPVDNEHKLRKKEEKADNVSEATPHSTESTSAETEDKRLRFVTKNSEVCQVGGKKCPVKTVDSMLHLLSKGVGKLLPQQTPHIGTDELQITTELVHTVQNILQGQLSVALGPEDFAPGSILIKPSDVETLLRTAEFRNDIVHKLKHLTTEIRLDYYQFMDDIERTQFYAAQQMEARLTDYQPLKLILISSTIPKAQLLGQAVKEGVLCHIYNFADALSDVLEAVRRLLEAVRPGAKAKHVAIVCKGGPGYFYIVKKTPVTPAKLRSNRPLVEFWRGLGTCMSKLIPGQTTLHLMESNMAGNKQGEKLLTDLESVLYAHQVSVSSPLELAPKGREMINLYFEPLKHKFWKNKRYTKLRLY